MLSRLTLSMFAVGLLLFAIQQALGVVPYYGIEDYLGWVKPDAIKYLNSVWQDHNVLWLASAYVWIDTILFMPIYGMVFLALGRQIFSELAGDANRDRYLLAKLYTGLLLAVLAIDLAENTSGLAKIVGGPAPLFLLMLTLAIWSALGWWFKGKYRSESEEIWRYCRKLGWPVVLTALLIIIGVNAIDGVGQCIPASTWITQVGCKTHHAKFGAFGFLVVFALLAALLWFSGLCIPRMDASARAARSELRIAIADIVARSRYVLAGIIIFSGTALVMDQGRDLLAATASQVAGIIDHNEAQPTVLERLMAVGTAMLGLLVTALGIWMFCFSCWLWSRATIQASNEHARQPERAHFPQPANQFAQEWARLLGLAPLIILTLLCAATFGDAVRVGAWPTATVLALFCASAIYWGYYFVNGRIKRGEEAGEHQYYRCWVKPMRYWPVWGRDQKNARYWLFGHISPFWLPVVAAALLFACRFPISFPESVPDAAPPMALPIMLFSIVLWLGLFGWLSLFEQRTSTGWFGVLVVIVGTLGFGGLTDNHVVGGFLQSANPMSIEVTAFKMYGWTIAISLVGFAAYAYVIQTVGRGTSLTPWRCPLAFLLPILLSIPLMCLAGKSAANLPTNPESTTVDTSPPKQMQITVALKSWLDELYESRSQYNGKALPVYFVSSEGGGIRAAYWTARILADMEFQVENFPATTFSMSGVSGGAMGIAVYHACRQEPPYEKHATALSDCVSKFGKQDLLSPMVGAWLYEDLLARVIPTSWCDAPGCGFLSRGIWFENSMLSAVENLQQGIVKSYQRDAGRHQPHLFLNSTWVETGERAIASNLEILPQDFPNANDQIQLLGRDMSLATAAHNASRFPFVNAIGSVKPVSSQHKETIGHLADGGYFDNSGGQTTADILKKFGQCFTDSQSGCWIKNYEQRIWLAQHLFPQVLMIRNGVETPLPEESMAKNECKPRKQPDKTYLNTLIDLRSNSPYQPIKPACKSELKLFADFLGPLVTAINTTGIGSNGKLAESRLKQEVGTVRSILSSIARPSRISTTQAEVKHLDLSNSNQLVPLGWHLSTLARRHMDCEAVTAIEKNFFDADELAIRHPCSPKTTSNCRACQ